MPEFDKLDNYIDEAGLIKDTDFFLGLFKKLEDGGLNTAEKLKSAFSSFGASAGSNSGVKATIDGLNQLNLTTANYKKVLEAVIPELDNLTDAQKAQLKVINEQYKAEEQIRAGAKETVNLIKTEIGQIEKLDAGRTALAQTLANNNEKIRQEGLERKRLAAVLNAEDGSRQKAQAIIDLLINKGKKLNLETEQGRRVNDAYNKTIKEQNDFLLSTADVETKRIKNIGNYAAATNASAKIIVDALEKEKASLKELQTQRTNVQNAGANFKPSTAFGGSNNTISGSAGGGSQNTFGFGRGNQDLNTLDDNIVAVTQKIEVLQKVVDKPQFLKLAGDVGDAAAEIRFFTKALIDLERSGEGNSEAAKQLRNNLAQLTDQVADAKAEVKALSSDTRSFDLFAGSVSFAADALQTAAGAAALFGASEKETQEAIKNVVAIQSIANGVKGIANELTTRGTAANKVFAFAQSQVTTALDSSAAAGARLKAAFITLGIGALIIGIGLLVANFQKIKEALTGLTGAAKEYAERQKLITEVNKAAAESAGKETAALNINRKAIENVNIPMETRLQAVKNIKKEFPEYFAGLTNEQILAGKVGGAYDLAAAAIIRKARANAAAAEIEKLSSANLQIQLTQLLQAEEVNKKIANARNRNLGRSGGGSSLTGGGGGGSETVITKEEQQRRLKEDFQLKDKAANDEVRLNQNKIDVLIALTNLGASETIKIETDKVEKAKAVTKKFSNDDLLKSQIDAEKAKEAALLAIAIANANEKIRVAQSVIDNENAALEDQNKAIATIYNERVKIESLTSAAAIASEKQVQDGKIVEVKKGTQVINKELNDFNIKYGLLNEEAANKRLEVEKKQTEKLKLEYEKQKQAKLEALDKKTDDKKSDLEIQFDKDSIALNNQFVTGKISLKKYNEEKLNLEMKFQKDSLFLEIDKQKQLLEIVDLLPEEQKKALLSLLGLEKQVSDIGVQRFITAEEKKRVEFLKTLNLIQEKADVVFNIVGSILDASAIKQKNKLAEEKNEIEKKTAAEIEAVNASGDSEEKKAARIAIINARALSQKEAITRRERQIELDKAKFDKAQTVFRLTLALAEAIASLNAFKIVAATIQLGVAIATPIPKFAKGLQQDYEGPAIVGDGRRKEAIIRKDGSVEITPNTDTLTYINKGDRIMPDADLYLQDMQQSAMRDMIRAGKGGAPITEKQYGFDMAAALENNAQKIVTAIKNKPENHLSAKEGALVSLWKHGANTTKYFEENTNWNS